MQDYIIVACKSYVTTSDYLCRLCSKRLLGVSSTDGAPCSYKAPGRGMGGIYDSKHALICSSCVATVAVPDLQRLLQAHL